MAETRTAPNPGTATPPVETPPVEAPPNNLPATKKTSVPVTKRDNKSPENARGKVKGPAPKVPKGGRGLLVDGAILVGRVLFDPAVFGDRSDYFADTPTHDDYERELVKQGNTDIREGGANPKEVREQVRRDIEQHREEQKKKGKGPSSDPDKNVQIKSKCKIGRYGDLKSRGSDPCPSGQHAHHVPPDYALRYGSRPDLSSRMPDLPEPNDGLAICLSASDHTAAHRLTDPEIAKLGGADGYAPLGGVLDKSLDGVKDLKKNDEAWDACMKELRKQAAEKYKGKEHWPVRTTKSPPGFPTSDIPSSVPGM